MVISADPNVSRLRYINKFTFRMSNLPLHVVQTRAKSNVCEHYYTSSSRDGASGLNVLSVRKDVLRRSPEDFGL